MISRLAIPTLSALCACGIVGCSASADAPMDGAARTDAGTASPSDSSTPARDAQRLDGGPPSNVPVWFRTDFDDLNAAGSNLYDFANRYGQSTATWETTHDETGGWLGSGAPHVVIHGCDGTLESCNTSEHQFSIGWTTPEVGGTRQLGDAAFIRFRIRFDPGAYFAVESEWGAKFILFGRSEGSPNSRWIIHLEPPFKNQGCSLGFDYSHMRWRPSPETWTDYMDWGFAHDFGHESMIGLYASFESNVNIDWDCNPGVLVTRADHAAPVPPPQSIGAAPQDGWYHLQFEAVTGPDGTADFRTWANNNDRSRPSSEHLDMEHGLGVIGWDGSVDVGGYWGTADMPDLGFIIDDFEIGPEFDPTWAR
jgi:hypothetical protein